MFLYYGKNQESKVISNTINSTFANFKINKQTKRKRNSRGQLQGRLTHHSNLLRDGRII